MHQAVKAVQQYGTENLLVLRALIVYFFDGLFPLVGAMYEEFNQFFWCGYQLDAFPLGVGPDMFVWHGDFVALWMNFHCPAKVDCCCVQGLTPVGACVAIFTHGRGQPPNLTIFFERF